jgi:hypothetical protein
MPAALRSVTNLLLRDAACLSVRHQAIVRIYAGVAAASPFTAAAAAA